MVPVSCKLCSSLGGKSEHWTLDDRKAHAQFHAIQSGYVSENGNQPSVKQVFAKCFPLEDFDKSEKIEKSRSTLIKICHNIIANKKNETNSIKCQVCDKNVRYTQTIGNGKYHRCLSILVHACRHSTKKPFRCRRCKHESATKSDIVYHVTNAHKIASPIIGVHFTEDWIVCFDKVKESLTKSFVRLNLNPSSSTKIETPPSELSIQRRSVFLNILKNANVDNKIRCNICRTEITAKASGHLEQHICTHLQQLIFECAMCGEDFVHKPAIRRHLTEKHGGRSKGNYIDRSDDHHEAILEWAKKCFGNKKSK